MKKAEHAAMSLSLALAAVSVMSSVHAASAESVSDIDRLVFSEDAVLTVSSIRVDGYPSGLEVPAFWFDASSTNGWLFSSSGGITNIPSKTGSRQLQFRPAGATWDGWGKVLPLEPSFVGGDFPYVDLGERGSKKSLVFDAVDINGTSSNIMTNIGTIVSVIKTSESWIMGGGVGLIDWHRGVTGNAKLDDKLNYANPLLHHGNSKKVVREAWTRHNGFDALPCLNGWTGEWEVFVYSPLVAEACATGIGMGDARNGGHPYSGGQKIAEMLVFDRVLSKDDVRLLEVWLRKKWFSRRTCGYNGYGRVGELRVYSTGETPSTLELSLAEGETLRADRVSGGLDASDEKDPEIHLTGKGTFEPGNIADWNGTLRVSSGTLRLASKPVPTLESLPSGCYLHFDVSDAASREVDPATGELISITNTAAGSFVEFSGVSPYLLAIDPERRPLFRPDATPKGLPVADFGKSLPDNAGRMMRLHRLKENVPTVCTAPGVTTMIALVGGENDGGHMFDGSFCRNGPQPSYVSGHIGLFKANFECNQQVISGTPIPPTIPVTNGMVVVDGIRRKVTDGLAHWGYQAIAVQVPGSSPLSRLGVWSSDVRFSGGAVIGEIFLYNRHLTEEEILDVQAYLSKKWLGKTLPGYASVADAPAVQSVTADGDSVVEVPDGCEVRLGKLAVSGKLVKIGGGTLKVDEAAVEGQLTVREGAIALNGPGEPDSESDLAAGPSLHLDASRRGSLVTEEIDGTNFVTVWSDDVGGKQAYSYSMNWSGDRRPFVGFETLNGLPTVDFGVYQGSGERENQEMGLGCYLHLTEALNSVRSAFVVSRFKEGNKCGPILGGSNRNGEPVQISFIRSSAGHLIYSGGNISGVVRNGETFINGEKIEKPHQYVPGSEFALTEFHTTGGAHVSALCVDRWNTGGYSGSYRGGQVVAEIVIYERELSEREKIATRNYLRQKWFGAEPAELPVTPAAEPIPYVLENLVADGAAPAGVTLAGAAVTIPAAPVVRLVNMPATMKPGEEITLFVAESIEGAENLRNATFTGEAAPSGPGGPLRVRRRGKAVVAVYGENGMRIIVK